MVAPGIQTTAISMLTGMGFFGAFVGPIIAGSIISRIDYQLAFLIAGSVALLGVVLAWYAPEPQDYNNW